MFHDVKSLTYFLTHFTYLVPALLGNVKGVIFNETKNQSQVINITMNCTADGIPKPSIIWFYDDVILNLKPRVTIVQQDLNRPLRDNVVHPHGTSVISILSISNANQRDDSGRYACQAENIGGRSLLTPPNDLIINVGMKCSYLMILLCI